MEFFLIPALFVVAVMNDPLGMLGGMALVLSPIWLPMLVMALFSWR